jgi:hypothetical protein
MDNNEEFFIRQQTGETTRAYRAKKDYLAMGPGRSLEKLLALYRARNENGMGTAPTLRKATLAHWSGRWGWSRESALYDDFQSDRLLEQEMEERRAELSRKMEHFRANHEQVGKGGFKAIAVAVQKINQFLDEHPEGLSSLDDCVKAAGLVRSLTAVSDWWSKAIAVDSMLQKLDLEE